MLDEAAIAQRAAEVRALATSTGNTAPQWCDDVDDLLAELAQERAGAEFTYSREFVLPGIPQQQGSKKGFARGRKVTLVEANAGLKPWRADAIAAIQRVLGSDWRPVDAEMHADYVFCFPRPKGHFGTGRNAAVLKASAPTFKDSSPDLDKLERAVNDALTQSGFWRDDSRLVESLQRKIYTLGPPCTRVTVSWSA